MDGSGDPRRDVAEGRASRLTADLPAADTAFAKPRIAIVSNGNYFAALGLARLLRARAGRFDFVVFVTTGLRHPTQGPLGQGAALLRRWGPRYAAYKLATLVLPSLAQLLQRRPYTLAALADAQGVPVRRCRDLNHDEAFAALERFAPDLLISFSCPYRLQPHVLAVPKLGALNVHSSLLPAYAGVCTYVHALANGERTTGITIHAMTERFDAGAILAQAEVPIEPGCSVFELFTRQCHEAQTLLLSVVDGVLATRRLDGTPQDLSRRTYHGEPAAEDVRRLKQRGHHLFLRRDLRRLWSAAGHIPS